MFVDGTCRVDNDNFKSVEIISKNGCFFTYSKFCIVLKIKNCTNFYFATKFNIKYYTSLANKWLNDFSVPFLLLGCSQENEIWFASLSSSQS